MTARRWRWLWIILSCCFTYKVDETSNKSSNIPCTSTSCQEPSKATYKVSSTTATTSSTSSTQQSFSKEHREDFLK